MFSLYDSCTINIEKLKTDSLDQGRPNHKGHLAKLGRDEQEQEEI